MRDLLAQLADLVALADHHEAAIDVRAQCAIFRFELALTERVAHDEDRLVERERLFDEVERAHLDRADGGLDVAVARDDDDFRVDAALAQARQSRQAIDAGQPHVEQDDIHRLASDHGETRFPTRHRLDVVPFVAQHARKRGPHARFVINDQNARLHTD